MPTVGAPELVSELRGEHLDEAESPPGLDFTAGNPQTDQGY